MGLVLRAHLRILLAPALPAVCVGLIGAAVLISFTGLKPVFANGVTSPVVENAPAGPYEVQVGIFPGRPKMGIVHLSISMTDAEAGTTITDAVVMVMAKGPEGVPILGPFQAINTPRNPHLYEADVDLDRRGVWIVTLDMDSPLGKADLDFAVGISNTGGLNWAYALAGPILIVIFGTWAWRRSRGQQTRQ